MTGNKLAYEYSSIHAKASIFKHRCQHVQWRRDIKLHNPQLVFTQKTFPFFSLKKQRMMKNPSSFIGTLSCSWDREKGMCFLFGDFYLTEKHMAICYPMFHHHLVMILSEYVWWICFWKNHLESLSNQSQDTSFDAFFVRLQDASLCSCKYLHFGQSFIRWCRSWFALGTLRLGVKKYQRSLPGGRKTGGDGILACEVVFVGFWCWSMT